MTVCSGSSLPVFYSKLTSIELDYYIAWCTLTRWAVQSSCADCGADIVSVFLSPLSIFQSELSLGIDIG